MKEKITIKLGEESIDIEADFTLIRKAMAILMPLNVKTGKNAGNEEIRMDLFGAGDKVLEQGWKDFPARATTLPPRDRISACMELGTWIAGMLPVADETDKKK